MNIQNRAKIEEIMEEVPVGPDYARRNHCLFLSPSRRVDCDHDAKNDNFLLAMTT